MSATTTPLTEAQHREMRERFIGYRGQLKTQMDQVDRILRELDAICPHVWEQRGHSGPYTRHVCRRCGAEEFIP